MSENFETMLESELTSKNIIPGTIVKGTVVDIENNYVVVDAGLKSEGVIDIQEFGGEVEIGDVVEVALEKYENGFGETVLSREKAKRMLVWDQLQIAMDTDQIVIGQITSKVRGGFTVELKDIRAFLPGSLVDVRPVRDPGYLEGKDLEFKVIKLDQKRNNVVVSRRAVVESDYSEDREKLLDSLEDGAIVKGIVKNLTDYGAFLDLGGIDGLLHITDMSWKRVNHPSEVVEIGQELEVRVLKFDKEQQRVSLGLKQLGEDPWKDLSRRHPVGSRHFGNVTNITDYGCFVEIQDGIEGLVHVSEMDWTNKNIHPSKVVNLGDEIEVMVDNPEDLSPILISILEASGERSQVNTDCNSSDINNRPARGLWSLPAQRHQAVYQGCNSPLLFWVRFPLWRHPAPDNLESAPAHRCATRPSRLR